MRAIVVHPSLNLGGGAEKVCLTTVKALKMTGNWVKLVTIDKTDWHFLEQRFGKLVRPCEEAYLIEKMPVRTRFSQAAFTILLFLPELFYYKAKNWRDVVVNTYGDIVDSIADVVYVNAVPAWALSYCPESEMSASFSWLFFSKVYGFFLNMVRKLFVNSFLLANSVFMQGVLKKLIDRESFVVYPPVDVEKFKPALKKATQKKRVVTVCRFRRGRNLQLIPQIAKLVEHAEFIVVGLADEGSDGTINLFTSAAKRLGVEERIKLLVNVQFDKLADSLLSAKIFLQTAASEAFGISVVEAMAAGCVPVVRRDGGPWFDILDRKQGTYGYSYTSVQEAAKIIKTLIEDEDLRRTVSLRARERVQVFSSSVFERKILNAMKNTYFRKL